MIKEALRVQDREAAYMRPVSATLGRLGSPTTALLMGSMAPMGATAGLDNPEIAAAVAQLKEDPALADVTLSLGSVRPLDRLADIWDNENIGLASKLLGTATSPIQSAITSVNRMDHYDPYSNRVTLFSADPAVLHHEMGHAKDFGESNYPIGYALARNIIPGMALYQEGQASLRGLHDMMEGTNISNPEDVNVEELQADIDAITRGNKVLGGGIGSYAGFGLGSLIGSRTSAGKMLADKLAPILKLPAQYLKGTARAALGVTGALGGALLGQALGYTARPFTQGDDRAALLAAEELLKSASINSAISHDAEIKATEKLASRASNIVTALGMAGAGLMGASTLATSMDPKNQEIHDRNWAKVRNGRAEAQSMPTPPVLPPTPEQDNPFVKETLRAIQATPIYSNQPSVSNPWGGNAPVGRPPYRPRFENSSSIVRPATKPLG